MARRVRDDNRRRQLAVSARQRRSHPLLQPNTTSAILTLIRLSSCASEGRSTDRRHNREALDVSMASLTFYRPSKTSLNAR
jgi:hypothetical protein